MNYWNYRLVDFDGYLRLCEVYYDADTDLPRGFMAATVDGDDMSEVLETLELISIAINNEPTLNAEALGWV